MVQKKFGLVFVLLTLLLTIFLCVGVAQAVDYTSANYCKNITISNAGSTTLTNFPVFLNVPYESGKMQADWDDIGFVNSYCNDPAAALDYEFVENDSTAAEVWVRIPSLPSGNTIISMYYGNPNVGSGENPMGVWSNYGAVWHMLDNDTSSIQDSTSNDNNGIKSAANEPLESVGQIYNAQDFDGTVDNIAVADDNSLDILDGSWTISFWARQEGACTYAAQCSMFYKGGTNDANDGYRIQGDDDTNNYDFWVSNGSERITASSNSDLFMPNQWAYLSMICDRSNDRIYIYVNGNDETSGTPACPLGAINDTSYLVIGAFTGREFNGLIDEIKIAQTRESGDWINMSYQIVENQNNLINLGDEEEVLTHEQDSPPPTGGGGQKVRTPETKELCEWNCTEWSECDVSRYQTRTCTTVGTCDSEDKPEEKRECEYNVGEEIKKQVEAAKASKGTTGKYEWLAILAASTAIITILGLAFRKIRLRHRAKEEKMKERNILSRLFKRK